MLAGSVGVNPFPMKKKRKSEGILRSRYPISPEQVTFVRQRGIGVLDVNKTDRSIKVRGGTRKIKRLCKAMPSLFITEIREVPNEELELFLLGSGPDLFGSDEDGDGDDDEY